MTTPNSRPIHDVIADAAGEVLSRRLGGFGSWGGMTADLAATILAACQQATVAQQAELTKAEVERRAQAIYEGIYLADERIESRLVGPWREDPS